MRAGVAPFVFAVSVVLVLLMSLAIPTIAATNSVEQWGIYEIELKGPTNGNPFVDVQLSAVFDNGDKRVKVPGFYDGDGDLSHPFHAGHAGPMAL